MPSLSYLYVEDDRLSRSVMAVIMVEMLRVSCYTVFEDSTDFMERVRALPARPDVFLLDIQMTPHSGFEMLQMLRADPDYRDCRVIALTASVMNEEVNQLRAAGFDGTIAKPLDLRKFPELLERIERGESVWSIT